MGFDHDPNSPSKLLSHYFSNATDRVLKANFLRVFKEDGLIMEDDIFNMLMIYFINIFILSSPPKNSHIPKITFYVLGPDSIIPILGAIYHFSI